MAEPTVTEFLSRFPLGFARPNRYMIEMSLPPGIGEQGSWLNDESTSGPIQAHNMRMNRTRTGSNRMSHLHDASQNTTDLSTFTTLRAVQSAVQSTI